MSNRKLGTLTLGKSAASDCVVIERALPGSINLVWRYLTEPQLLSRWLAGGTVERRKGGSIHLDFDLIDCPGREAIHGTMSGVISVCDPPRRLTYSWNEGAANRSRGPAIEPISTVTFELTELGDASTHLKVTHRRIRREELPGIAAGWHVHVDTLASRLLDTEPVNFMAAWAVLERKYGLELRNRERIN